MLKTGILISLWLCLCSPILAQYTIQSVPDPKLSGSQYYVSDPDGILGREATRRLNEICTEIEKETTAEVAVVAVNDFQGSSDFDFAYALFNHLGIGKQNNNGLLLFIAKNRRKYRFITGYAMEGRLPDVTLGSIGETYLVSRFRQGDYGGAAIDALNGIRQILLNPDQALALRAVPERSGLRQLSGYLLTSLVLLVVYFFAYRRMNRVIRRMKLTKSNTSFILVGCLGIFFIFFAGIFIVAATRINLEPILQLRHLPYLILIPGSSLLWIRYWAARQLLAAGFKDKETLVTKLVKYDRMMWFPMLVSPLCFLSIFNLAKHKRLRNLHLRAPDLSGKWKRVNKDIKGGISKYLNSAQRQEEKLKSMSYEVWLHEADSQIKLMAWPGARYKKYEDCPGCKYHTLSKVYTKTIQSPTYTKSGLGTRVQTCQACKFEQSFGTVILPKRVRTTSTGSGSSSGSGSSGSSSSSRSSSGSWGGGRSGGGGAGELVAPVYFAF